MNAWVMLVGWWYRWAAHERARAAAVTTVSGACRELVGCPCWQEGLGSTHWAGSESSWWFGLLTQSAVLPRHRPQR